MEDLPPSYGSLFNEHRSGLSYIDFLPDGVKEGFFSKPDYARFENIVDCANEWLRLNTQWNIKTCESIEFKASNGVIKPSKMSYYESAKHRTNFIRGLRLWLKIFPAGEERVQKIGYVNLVPQEVVPGGVFTHAKYETLDDVLLRFNNASRTSPLPGRIITIETQEMKIKRCGLIDPDRSSWTEFGEQYTRYIYVIRIFYEVCDPLYEEIGITDFIPKYLESSCLGLFQKYETFSALFEKASYWCSNQSDLRICNIQSLATKIQNEINTRKMSYTEHGRHRVSYVRTLRVAHIRQQPLDCTSPVRRFSYKSFVPAQLNSSGISNLFMPKFETLQDVMQKVSNWIQATDAEVLSMETSAVQLHRKGAIHSSEKNYFYESGNADFYVFVIRAYLKGSYTEPF